MKARIALFVHGSGKASIAIDRLPGSKKYYCHPTQASIERVAKLVENIPLADTFNGDTFYWSYDRKLEAFKRKA